MLLYTTPHCPYVQRVVIASNLIGREIPTESMAMASQSVLRLNPAGTFPTLQIEPGLGFGESMTIVEYLDALPSTSKTEQRVSLFGSTPLSQALTRNQLDLVNSGITGPIQRLIYARGQWTLLQNALANLPAAAKQLEAMSSPYLGGKHPNVLDVSLFPFAQRLLLLKKWIPQLSETECLTVFQRYVTLLNKNNSFSRSVDSIEGVQDALEKFTIPYESILKILQASRTILVDLSAAANTLNSKFLDCTVNHTSSDLPIWKVKQTDKGPQFEAHFEITKADLMPAIWAKLSDIQESADHHAHITVPIPNHLHISVCTHEPVWGLSDKDVALCEAFTNCIFEH
jgi:glutathione S-transferase